MAWRITSDSERYNEALDWFLRKNLVTREQADQMRAASRDRSFWVSGAAQLRCVQDVYDEIQRAVQGGTLGEFKKAVREKLTKAWAGSVKNPAWRVEVIFRTNVQSAYAAGRWHQLQHPALVRFRPFLMFDAVLDGRTSDICAACSGTTLERDDPWWSTHFPPLHHACRSTVRALTKRQAAKRPEDKRRRPEDEGAAEGFGSTPQDIEWQPKAESYSPELWQKFERKAATAGKQVVAAPTSPPKPPKKPASVGGLTQGTHYDSLFSVLTTAETNQLLRIVDARLRNRLASNRLGDLSIRKGLYHRGKKINGSYQSPGANLDVEADRAASTFGQKFNPGQVFSVSSAGGSAMRAMQRTLVHELGHHLHRTGGAQVDKAVRLAFKRGRRGALTRYARYSYGEYFAESFAAWRFHRSALRTHDPVGYAMVEKVLKLLRML